MKYLSPKLAQASRSKNELYKALINAQRELENLDEQIQVQIHTEEMLRESESRYRAMFELNPQPMFVMEADTAKFLAVNQAAVDHYGYSEREFMRMTGHQIREPQQIQQFVSQFQNEGMHQTVSKHRAKNGQSMDVKIISQAITYAGRRARLVIVEDITEKTKAERALNFLNESSLVLASTLDSKFAMEKVVELSVKQFGGLVCCWHLKPNGEWEAGAVGHERAERVTFFKESIERFPPTVWDKVGPVDVVKKGKSALVSEVDEKTLAGVARSREHFEFLKALNLKSYMCVPLMGRDQPLGAISLFSVDNHYSKFDLEVCEMLSRRVAMALDNARLYEQTRQAAVLIDTFFKVAPVGLAYVDDEMKYRRINDCLAASLNVKVEDMVGKKVSDLHNVPAEVIEREFKRILSEGNAVINREVTYEKPDETRSYMASYYPMRFDGQRGGLGVVIVDVTERINFEKKLEDSVRMRDEFVSVVSHELKTPVTSLKLQMQFMRHFIAREKLDPARFDRLIKAVNSSDRQMDRLSRLIRDLLDLSRIRAGKMSLEYETFDFCELVNTLIDRYRSDFNVAGCTVTSKLCKAANGTWDRMRVEQIVTNLLSNAMKYGANRPIAIAVGQENNQVYLTVEDAGIGIRHEDLNRIFNKFERAVADSRFAGLGLGLYITQQIVKALGGEIHVESEFGKGSKFTVRLPTVPTEQQRCAVSGDLLSEGQLLN